MNFNGMQFQSSVVQQMSGMIKGQGQVANDMMSRAKGFTSIVNGAWKGGDAEAFAGQIAKKFVPAIVRLINSLTFFGQAINKAMDTLSNAENKASSMINNLGDVFGQIAGGLG